MSMLNDIQKLVKVQDSGHVSETGTGVTAEGSRVGMRGANYWSKK